MPKPIPRKEATARNREKLLDAAAKVIGKSGLVGATLQEIATAAGLTKGAVYSRFDSKEDLLIELLDRRFEVGHAQLMEVLSGDKPMMERLAELDTWHRGEKGNGRLWATLELELSIAAARQPKLRRKLRDRQRRSREFLAEMVEKIADENNLTLPLPPADFAIVLSALSDGLLVHWLNDAKAVPDNLFARFIISTVLGASGIKPPA
ncbi:MAG: hypothetical protein CBC48_19235 [bacterium TMED88]|nr:hypothetical protein [Deltaproteobacteria bacterium]MDG2051786.1 TetR/AcrR family transcriptional regulator [Myxococcota bacterium]OUV23095.1 MAG: hypothetical protein CBC48_19235 [bacterium TMED88]